MLNYFASPQILIIGLIIGFLFGFLLQKGGVTKANVIFKQFIFKDFTMIKVMFTAIITGMIFLYASSELHFIKTIFMPHSSILAVIIGGSILGIGLAIAGYCPGTSFVAAGQGSKDAWFSILGLFIGASIYAEIYPWFKKTITNGQMANRSTIQSLIGISPWIIISTITICGIIFFMWLEKKKV